MVKINDYQKDRFTQKIIDHFKGDVTGKRIAILGWAFKPNTNDSRESPAIYVASKLIQKGAFLYLYDPKVPHKKIKEDLNLITNKNLNNKFEILNSIENVVENVDAVAILTNWDIFNSIDFKNKKLFMI